MLKTLILAAGKGTRMKSDLPKVLHKTNGIPMIVRIIKVLEKLSSQDNILVLGHKKEQVLKIVGKECSYVEQLEQLGTGHAVIQAKEKLINYDGDIMILCGDTPLITEETLKKLLKCHQTNDATATILTAIYENPFGYGRIIKENGLVKGIVEEKEATEEVKKIKEVNAGIYCFKSKKLFSALEKINNKNRQGEYYLTDVIEVLVNDMEKVQSYIVQDNIEILGVNSKIELAYAEKILRDRKNIELMRTGVTIIDPNNTYIEDGVTIGKDTVIYPNVFLQGDTTIGEKCEILSGTRIIDTTLGNNVKIESSVIEESIVENNVTIGPFAHLRPKTHLKEKVHIGNFVEIKKSFLETEVKVGHLTYIGDAEIGEKTNIGAGTITCNYDGKNKFKSVIGKNSFVGSGTMLVAPINLGEFSFVGAGSVITKDVPNKALGVSRSKQINKLEWRKKNG